jgi:hypothetical protein
VIEAVVAVVARAVVAGEAVVRAVVELEAGVLVVVQPVAADRVAGGAEQVDAVGDCGRAACALRNDSLFRTTQPDAPAVRPMPWKLQSETVLPSIVMRWPFTVWMP